MNDEFLKRARQAPPPDFASALYERINLHPTGHVDEAASEPGKTVARWRTGVMLSIGILFAFAAGYAAVSRVGLVGESRPIPGRVERSQPHALSPEPSAYPPPGREAGSVVGRGPGEASESEQEIRTSEEAIAAARATGAIDGAEGSAIPTARTVESLLANPPRPMESVEIVAYHGEGYMSWPGRGRFESMSRCPSVDMSPLTDEPFWQTLSFDGSHSSNLLPEGAPWLIAADPGDGLVPELPKLARMRGHLGDPAFAHCDDADRIFVVEEVLDELETKRPLSVPDDRIDAWQWHEDDARRFRLGYPPEWQMTSAGAGSLTLRSDSSPHSTMTLHVSDVKRGPHEAGEPSDESWRPNRFEQHAPPQLVDDRVPALEGDLLFCAGDIQDGCVEVVFHQRNVEYRLRHEYGTGFEADGEAMQAFNDIAHAFRIDGRATVTPVPAAKTELGPGPFWTREEAEETALHMIPFGPWEVTDAQLVSEADAVHLNRCDTNRGDPDYTWYSWPDGVWIIELTGTFEDRQTVYYTYLDAETGGHLCTAEEGRPMRPPGNSGSAPTRAPEP